MKIVKLRTAVVQANFHWSFVRIYSDADGGLYGTGECFFAPGLVNILQEMEPLLQGEDPLNVGRLVEKLRWAASGAGSLGGIIWNAITGIETALLDLKGKALGIPVYQLLGGRFADHARIYVDAHAGASLEALSPLLQPQQPAWMSSGPHEESLAPDALLQATAQHAHDLHQAGWDAMKFDLDLPGSTFDSPQGYPLTRKDIDWMVQLATGVREAVGDCVELAFDAHWRYRTSDMLVLAKALEPLGLMWLEDPLPPHDLEGLARLKTQTITPIATGENLQLCQGFWPLLKNDLLDVVTPDLQKAGGLMEAKRISDLAHMLNKSVAPHMIGSPLAMMAAAHLCVAIPNALVCEFHGKDVPFYNDMVQANFAQQFTPGKLTVNDQPGLGTELNLQTVKRYRLPGSCCFDESD